MQIFAQLTKVNEADRTVEGVIATETPDRAGEVFDYAASKSHFVDWSEAVAKATGGKNIGNVRAMHGNVSAGITKALNFDDAAKCITVKAEITDDNEWRKVQKGNYTGFSIGGKYGRKWEDGALRRYEAIPNEYSLVDLPCNPDAQFTVIKADGSNELRKFENTTDAESLRKWVASLTDDQRDELAKAAAKEGDSEDGGADFADAKNKKYPLDTEKRIRAAWAYIHMPKNAGKYGAEDLKAVKDAIVAAWKKKIDPAGPEEANAKKWLDERANRIAKHANAGAYASAIAALIGYEPGALEKGLWDVSQLAQLIQQLACMADGVGIEALSEGDGSQLPEQFRTALLPLAQAFLAMAAEEVDEALHGQLGDDATLAAAARNGGLTKMLGSSNDDVHQTLDDLEDETDPDDTDSLDHLDDARDALGDSDDVAKGDFPGHPFRGNQYAGGSGDTASSRASHRAHNASKATLGKGNSKSSHEAASASHARAAHSANRAGNGKLQAYHEHMAKYHASRAARFKKADDGDMAKAADDLAKMTAERDDALTKLAELTRQYAEWLKQPAMAKGAARVVAVEKTIEAQTAEAADSDPVLKADGSVDHIATAIKLTKVAYQNPRAGMR